MLASFRQSCLEFEVSNACKILQDMGSMRVGVIAGARRRGHGVSRPGKRRRCRFGATCLVQVSTAESNFEEFNSKAKKFRDDLKASVLASHMFRCQPSSFA